MGSRFSRARAFLKSRDQERVDFHLGRIRKQVDEKMRAHERTVRELEAESKWELERHANEVKRSLDLHAAKLALDLEARLAEQDMRIEALLTASRGGASVRL